VSAPPRFRFFGGKGGVGKTTCAAADAVLTAERGRRVLLISTDPAHSLADAVGTRLSARPRRLPVRPGALAAVELDADRALERWLAARRRSLRTIADRGTYLDEDDVDRLLALSLPGVDELIGLIELHRLAREAPCDDVIVDTAPTGHTLRLLAMPETLARIGAVLSDMLAKHRFLGESLAGAHRGDAADALVAEIDGEARALHALLRDPSRAAFTWVLTPEPLALAETLDALRALHAAGIAVDEIIVNRITRPARACPLCTGRASTEADVIRRLRRTMPARRLRLIGAADDEPRGLLALRRLAAARPPTLARSRAAGRPRRRAGKAPDAPAWLETLAPRGIRVLVFAGKGGVGKTSAAAAVALGLAARRPGARLLLLSTDPAHSLADVLAVPLGDDERAVPGAAGLIARELDADAAFRVRRERYEKAVDELFDGLLRGSRFDVAYDREVVRELMDLAPPGLDELFGVLTLVDSLVRAEPPPYETVVVDTAPTGHALRLLAMPAGALEWVHALLAILLKYRAVIGLGELASDLLEVARELRELATLLRDATRTRVVAVTRPAALPRLETVRLLRGLRRLQIPVGGIIVNAVTPPGCARCRRALARERREATALGAAARSAGGARCAIISAPAESPPPGGVEGLRDWLRRWQWRG
jgi:arsenite/tail-anchored protein-transporting ATPase